VEALLLARRQQLAQSDLHLGDLPLADRSAPLPPEGRALMKITDAGIVLLIALALLWAIGVLVKRG
jgi:hypothetical protein